MTQKFQAKIECTDCQGTGLYKGMGERGLVAVVCYKCKGTGCFEYCYEYTPFVKRKDRPGIERVLERNPGIAVGAGQDDSGKVLKLEDFGGMPYAAWARGDPFPKGSEMRGFSCPAWYYHIGTSELDWCVARLGGLYSNCERFPDKAECWKQWDEDSSARRKTR